MKTLYWGPNLNLTEIMLKMKYLVITGPIKQTTAYWPEIYTKIWTIYLFSIACEKF